ncbi:MAG TPA: amino acid adenylation domain-containing protein, partial [Nitrospiraceae bacterium]|nr:amino acid adenylation domain-containing protein [Nitrospiraceae bacterium]
MEPDCRLNNVPVAVRLEGPLNVPALEAGLGSLIQRHEALRSTFGVEQGEPYQRVTAYQPFVLHQRDLRGLEQREYEGALRAEAGHHFDLVNGPLIRVTLLRLTDDGHVLLVTCHHLIIDGWSIRLLCKELPRAYEDACSGHPVTHPQPVVQYREYVSWQQKWLSREKRVSQTAYWTRQLHDLPPLLELPADAPRPSVGRHRSRQVSRSLDSHRTKALDRLCQRVGVTRFMVLTAAFAMLLHRYSGSDDVIVGTPVWNRRAEWLESVIGCLVNTVALRFDLSGDPTIEQFLRHVRTVLIEANDHQDLPYEEVVRALSPQQGGERRPLFTTMIVLDEDPTADLQLQEVRATRVPVERVATPVDLALIVYEGPQGIELTVEYDAGLFEQTTTVRLLEHLSGIIDGILEQSQRRLAQVSILTAEERHLLLTEWQGRDVSVPDGFVHDMIKAQADRIPEAFAVVTRQAYLTYRELDRRANQLAQYLRQLGVDRGALVGLCVERSVDLIVGLLGILKAGAAYVPLDPEYPQERLAFIVRDSRIAALVTHAHLGERVTFTEERVVYLDSDGPSITRCPDESPSSRVTTDDPAYVMYTSGSTGEPKGVVVTHRNLVHSTIAREQYYQGRVERFLLASSPAFDSSVAGIFWTLCQGGSLVIPAESDQRDPEALASWIAQYRITHVAWVPSLYQTVLREHAVPKLSSLQVVVVGGESLPLELVHRHYRFLPQATLYNEYGPTETTVWSCVYKTIPHEAGPRVPVGRPICNTRVYVLGPDLQPAPIGVVGEIYIGGGGVASGYLHRPELTAAQFVTHPISGGRLYKTGDRGRFCADGNIEFVGRVDRQVKVRGYRVELGEIESALRQIPVIRDAAVILQDMPSIGPVIVAYVTGESLSDSSGPRLRDYAREKLPGYMVPTTFVILESLPMTLSGKVDRLALPGLAQGQIADRVAVVAPRDQVEASLIEIWGKILGRHIESINDNFFDLGGHSLLAMQLISHTREVFGIEVALRRLFEHPTLAQLADYIRDEQRRGRGRGALPPIHPVSRETPLQLSYSQQRMWFINQLAPEGTAYNMPFASRQTGPLDRTALRRTLDELVRRHESFRTTFAMTGRGPVQIIAQWRSPSWGEIDLRRLPMEQRVQEAVQIVQNAARQSFDLEKGPLARFLLIQIDTEDHILVVMMHHIVGDQWSFGVMGREFATLYSAFCDGKESPLPPLPIHYADFAVWQRRCLTDEWLKEQSDYWTKELAHLPTLSLPTDYLRPAVQTFNGSYCVTELPTSVIDRLKQFSAQHHATSFMTLLACFQILLSRYSGQTDISIGSPIANRTQFAVEGLVGTFVNTLVLRTDLSGDPTFEEVIERVRETALDAYANQDFPFERLVETMQTDRDPSYPPLVQVLFNVGNTPIGEIFPRELTWVPFEVDPGSAQVDLSLTIETEIARKAYLTFNTDLFERRTAERMLGHYKLLLQSALADPKARISRLPLLSKSEWKQQVQEWNRTRQAYPRSACFHELFEAQVKRSPDALALSMGRNRLNYNELNARANQLARFLRNLGVGPGVTVGISLDRSPEMVIALIGVMKAGGTYVPLDPEYPPERIHFMMEDAAAAIVLTASAYADRFAMQGSRIVCLDSEQASLGREPDHDLVPAATSQDLVYILYTSGSTGQPKGVEVRHGSLVNVLWSMKKEPGCSPQDVWLSVTTLSFDIAGLELFLPL